MPLTLLIGLDGSTSSTAAVEFGIRWAKDSGAVLVGLGIVDEPTIRRPESVPVGATAFKHERDEALMSDAQEKVKQFLATFTKQCNAAGVTCRTIEDVGLPAQQIMLEAQRYDLILLGRETRFHFETQGDADETLEAVVKHGPRPVVAVPAQAASGSTIVVAYDGGVHAARTLQAFQALGLAGSRPVHVVCAHTDQAEAARRAERAVEFLSHHDIKAQPHAVASHAPVSAILDHVKQVDAGLLVMGAYGQPELKEFFFGSETRDLLRQTPVPVFLSH